MASTRIPRVPGAFAPTDTAGIVVDVPRTVEAAAFDPAAAAAQSASGEPIQFAGLSTSTRGRNDDRWRVAGEVGLLLLADGVSGYPAGDVAAELAVETACELVPDLLRHGLTPPEALVRAIAVCNEEIREFATSHRELAGMATTLVCALVHDGCLHVAHVGDSRGYLLRDGRLHRLTRDHCVGQQIIETGRLTEAQVAALPARGILTRALGLAEQIEPDLAALGWRVDDTVLLCSDGLTTALSDPVLEHLMLAAAGLGPAGQVRALVGGALQTAIPVNITALVATPADRQGPPADLDRPH